MIPARSPSVETELETQKKFVVGGESCPQRRPVVLSSCVVNSCNTGTAQTYTYKYKVSRGTFATEPTTTEGRQTNGPTAMGETAKRTNGPATMGLGGVREEKRTDRRRREE